MTIWHAPHDLLVRYATRPESIDHVAATSVETHLLSCADCRSVITEHTDGEWLERSWLTVADVVDRPKRTVAERALGWFVGSSIARVVAATRSLRWAWVAAIVLISSVLVVAARDVGSAAPFLLVAPVLPLLGVGLTFHPVPDPAGEAALACPMHGAGVVLYRALAVLLTTVAAMAPAAALLPQVGWWAIAWLVPALALTALAVGLCTWLTPGTAVGLVTVAWLATVYATAVRSLPDSGSDERALELFFDPGAQLAWLAVVMFAALTVTVRRQHLTMLEAR